MRDGWWTMDMSVGPDVADETSQASTHVTVERATGSCGHVPAKISLASTRHVRVGRCRRRPVTEVVGPAGENPPSPSSKPPCVMPHEVAPHAEPKDVYSV